MNPQTCVLGEQRRPAMPSAPPCFLSEKHPGFDYIIILLGPGFPQIIVFGTVCHVAIFYKLWN